VFAVTNSQASVKELPYYASIKASEANVRTGPSVKYPIRWVYLQPRWPIKISATFEDWRKISDIHGEAGWIHKSLLTTRRRAIVNSKTVEELYRLPLKNSVVVAILEKGVIVNIESCEKLWCKVKVNGKKGWISQKHLWGTFENETIE
jgi:SH3-like domain-containing protein